MQIKVYIEPDGEVTITALVGDMVPVAYALDRKDRQLRRWLDHSLQPGWDGVEEGEVAHGSMATCQFVEG